LCDLPRVSRIPCAFPAAACPVDGFAAMMRRARSLTPVRTAGATVNADTSAPETGMSCERGRTRSGDAAFAVNRPRHPDSVATQSNVTCFLRRSNAPTMPIKTSSSTCRTADTSTVVSPRRSRHMQSYACPRTEASPARARAPVRKPPARLVPENGRKFLHRRRREPSCSSSCRCRPLWRWSELMTAILPPSASARSLLSMTAGEARRPLQLLRIFIGLLPRRRGCCPPGRLRGPAVSSGRGL
jgi:hypothetical protein